ncbi:general substrate transporter [Dipodascopsis uninucleata]
MSEHQENTTDGAVGVGNHAKLEVFEHLGKEDLEGDFMDSEDIKKEAVENTERETKMSFFQALKNYRKAVMWSCFLSASLIMEGFDHSYISAFYGFTEFQKRYGVQQPDGSYAIPAKWQTAISDGLLASEILVLLFVGNLTDWFGYRKVMMGALLGIVAFIFIQFFSSSIEVYLVGEVLLGIPWGIFQTITTTYAAEVCPVALRGYLTVFVALCWTIGYLIGGGVLRGLLHLENEWAYKIAFALQWIWPIPIFIASYFAPESPWLLVRKGMREEAYVASRRLAGRGVTDKEVEETVAMMIHTDNMEKEANRGKSGFDSFMSLFKGTNFRRTEIAVITCSIQNVLNPLGSYNVVFLEDAGMSTNLSFDFSVIGSAIDILAVIILWILMERNFSRRKIFLFGLISSLISALIIGFLGIPKTTDAILYTMAIVLTIENFLSFLGVQATIYPIISELPSNALRPQTVGLARAVSNLVALINGILLPRMVNTGKDEWGWGPKTDLYYAGWLFLALIWAYFRLPDGTGRTYGEIDILFENKVAARKFRTTKVNVSEGRLEFDDENAEKHA